MIRPLYRAPGMPLQAHLAHPHRPEGATIDGTAGDCLRTAFAGALGLDRDTVPHFVGLTEAGWWWELQRWMREHVDRNVYLWTTDVWREYRAAGNAPTYPGRPYVVVDGPSPRGTFNHAVVADLDLNVVHDPHPLGVGITDVQYVWVLADGTYWQPPPRHALEAAA